MSTTVVPTSPLLASSYIVPTPLLVGMGIAALIEASLSLGQLSSRMTPGARKVLSASGLLLMAAIVVAVIATLTPTSVESAAAKNPPAAMRLAATQLQLAKEKEAEAAKRLAEIEAMTAEQRTSLIEAEKTALLLQETQAKKVQSEAMQKCLEQASAITGKPAGPADELVSACLQSAYPVGTYDAFALYNEAVGL